MLQGSGQLHSTFIEAMVAETRTEKEVEMWVSICRKAIGSLTDTSFTDSAALQSKLYALDVLLRPTLLQHIVVRRRLISIIGLAWKEDVMPCAGKSPWAHLHTNKVGQRST